MTKIAHLLDEQVKQQLQQVVLAQANADEPARLPTSSDEVDIDPESEAMIEVACHSCHASMTVVPVVPEGVDGVVRLFRCGACEAKTREEVAAQRNVEAIRRTRTAKHQPRITDGLDHPVETKKKKESLMIDLDNMSDAELGARVRKDLKASLAEQIKIAKPEVEAERKAATEAEREVVAGVQAERKTLIFPGFTLKTTSGVKEVPLLDVTNVSTPQEMPSAKERSPYNKALSGIGEPILDKEVTTYAVLIEVHQRLAGMVAEPKAEKAEVEKAKKATVIVAQAEPKGKAKVSKRKVKALADFLGITKEEAKERILARG